jgi:hypothetical protein
LKDIYTANNSKDKLGVSQKKSILKSKGSIVFGGHDFKVAFEDKRRSR